MSPEISTLLIIAEAHTGLNVHKANRSQATGELSRTRLLGRNQKCTKPNKQQRGFLLITAYHLSHPQKTKARRKQSKAVCSLLAVSPANAQCQGLILGLKTEW